MHFLTEYLVAVLISTEEVVRARQMKVGQLHSCRVTGAGRPNIATGRDSHGTRLKMIRKRINRNTKLMSKALWAA